VEVEKNEKGSQQKLYIMTFGVLAPYRNRGIGNALLNWVLKDLCKDRLGLEAVYLHVQISNTEALEFYKKAGFEITETIENYYKRIDPPHCHILQKKLK
jgi:ribosomal protein S18 acetylase RimI-like enzyme